MIKFLTFIREEQFKITGIISVTISIISATFFSIMISIPIQFHNISQYVISFIIFFSLTHLSFMYGSYLYVKELEKQYKDKNNENTL